MGDVREHVKIAFVGTPDVKRRSVAKPGNRPTSKMDDMATSKSIGKIGKELGVDIICHVSGAVTKKLKLSSSPYAGTMRRTVEEVSEKYEIKFRSMVQTLDRQTPIAENNVHATIDNIANKMLDDSVFNWGRLVTLYAFCSRLAKYCVDNNVRNSTRLAENIAEYLGEYVEEHLCKTIQDYGGWDGFVSFFPEPHALENKMWKGLIYTVVGLGALATMVAAR